MFIDITDLGGSDEDLAVLAVVDGDCVGVVEEVDAAVFAIPHDHLLSCKKNDESISVFQFFVVIFHPADLCRVTHHVSDFILLTKIDLVIPPCFLHVMPFLPQLQLPKQKEATFSTCKTNSANVVADLMGHPVDG